MKIHKAHNQDCQMLAHMNHQLIRDEGHRNPMNQAQLSRRMKKWLKGEYKAYLFTERDMNIGYCLFPKEKGFIYIRHFYIERVHRKHGLGHRAFNKMRKE